MNVFLDFEASSLAKASYPIEVAWVFETGAAETHLIRPAPGWIDWDDRAATTHKLTRAQLQHEGAPHDHVAHRMVEALTGHALFASAPSWDGKWLSVLLRAAGYPRQALSLRDTEVAQANAAIDDGLNADEAQALLRAIAGEKKAWPVQHRALDDARAERRAWLRTRELAAAWRDGADGGTRTPKPCGAGT